MPFIIMSAKLCPTGIEGIMWAFLVSVLDLASYLSGKLVYII